MKGWIMLLLLIAVAFSLLALVLLLLLLPGMPMWPKIILAAVIVFLLLSALIFRRLSIVLTEADISFGFGPLRRRLRWREIQSIKPEPYLFTRFIGWGIRYDLRDTFAFIAQSGMGVELKSKNRWRYFITTDDPEKLVKLSRARILKSPN